MECPCTTRTQRIITGFQTQSSGRCSALMSLSTPQECFNAVALLLSEKDILRNVTETKRNQKGAPSGCYILSNTQGNEAHFNTAANSTTECGATKGRPIRALGTADSLSHDLTIDLDVNSENNVTKITITGPSDVWFGVGFNASSMSDAPYTIVVEGEKITERKLANHMPGEPLQSSITVISNTVAPGKRNAPARMNMMVVQKRKQQKKKKGSSSSSSNSINNTNSNTLKEDMFGVSGWKECRLHCDQQREDWKMHLSQWCSGWTYIPEHFTTTPYNVQEGTCRVFTTTTLTPTPPTLDLLLEFTSNGWVEGMLSEYYAEEGEEEEGEVKQVRTVVLTRPLQGKTVIYIIL
jgi:hypothetical protein